MCSFVKENGDEPKYEPNTWAKLAIRLGVSVPSLTNWRKMEGAPKTPALKAWEEFVDANSLGVSGNRVGRGREELLKENLVKKNRLLDLEISEKEKKSVDRAEVDALLLHVATMQKTVLYPALERELPPRAEGKSASEISMMGRAIADRVCEIFTSSIESWKMK